MFIFIAWGAQPFIEGSLCGVKVHVCGCVLWCLLCLNFLNLIMMDAFSLVEDEAYNLLITQEGGNSNINFVDDDGIKDFFDFGSPHGDVAECKASEVSHYSDILEDEKNFQPNTTQ